MMIITGKKFEQLRREMETLAENQKAINQSAIHIGSSISTAVRNMIVFFVVGVIVGLAVYHFFISPKNG